MKLLEPMIVHGSITNRNPGKRFLLVLGPYIDPHLVHLGDFPAIFGGHQVNGSFSRDPSNNALAGHDIHPASRDHRPVMPANGIKI